MNDAIEKSGSIVHIDELNLDRECIRLPSDYLRYSHMAIEARRKFDELKADLDVVEAELAMSIRDNPQHYKLEKVTEAAINATVLTRKRYQEAHHKLLEARHEQEMVQAVVSALEHKKRSLTLLVELHGMGYFSDPKISKRGRDAVEDMMQRKARRPIRDKKEDKE